MDIILEHIVNSSFKGIIGYLNRGEVLPLRLSCDGLNDPKLGALVGTLWERYKDAVQGGHPPAPVVYLVPLA